MTRTPLKNLLLTALHLLICCAVSAGALCIQYLFMKSTGETNSSFLFTSELYKINPLMWLIGAVLGFAGLTAVLRRWLRQDFCCVLKHQPVWIVLWCLLVPLGILLMLAGNITVMVLRLGLMSSITFGRYDTLVNSCAVLFPAFTLILLLILCILTVRNRKQAPHEAV